MTIEEAEKRLKEIEQAMAQNMANFNMLEGGKSELLFWLDKLKNQPE
jgi:hypothetical protein